MLKKIQINGKCVFNFCWIEESKRINVHEIWRMETPERCSAIDVLSLFRWRYRVNV